MQNDYLPLLTAHLYTKHDFAEEQHNGLTDENKYSCQQTETLISNSYYLLLRNGISDVTG